MARHLSGLSDWWKARWEVVLAVAFVLFTFVGCRVIAHQEAGREVIKDRTYRSFVACSEYIESLAAQDAYPSGAPQLRDRTPPGPNAAPNHPGAYSDSVYLLQTSMDLDGNKGPAGATDFDCTITWNDEDDTYALNVNSA